MTDDLVEMAMPLHRAGAETPDRDYAEKQGKCDKSNHVWNSGGEIGAEDHELVEARCRPAMGRKAGEELHPFRGDEERPPAAAKRGQDQRRENANGDRGPLCSDKCGKHEGKGGGDDYHQHR